MKTFLRSISIGFAFFHLLSFSDIENIDWPTMKTTLSSSDAWSICRLGDYFVKNGKNKRRRSHNDHQRNHKEKVMKTMMTNGNYSDEMSSSDEDSNILEDIDVKRPLFRLTPLTEHHHDQRFMPIIEPGSSFHQCFFFARTNEDSEICSRSL